MSIYLDLLLNKVVELTGPREARSQTQYLVVLGTQQVLLLPAVHPGADNGRLVLGVEQHVLATAVRRVGELERHPRRRDDADVRQVTVPVLVGFEVALKDARYARRRRRRGTDQQQQRCGHQLNNEFDASKYATETG